MVDGNWSHDEDLERSGRGGDLDDGRMWYVRNQPSRIEDWEEVRNELLALATAVALTCGADSAPSRLLFRAAWVRSETSARSLQNVRLAAFALDQLPQPVQGRIVSVAQGLPRRNEPLSVRSSSDIAEPGPVAWIKIRNPSVSQKVLQTLRRHGTVVESTGDAADIQTVIETDPPALLVMDLVDPQADITALIVDALHRHIAVVLLCEISVRSTSPGLAFLHPRASERALLATVLRCLAER